jgi:hypothetical protein
LIINNAKYNPILTREDRTDEPELGWVGDAHEQIRTRMLALESMERVRIDR